MHPSTQVANAFLDLAQEKNVSLTPMQLIKLVYIAHGWMLALYDRPLISDEVQAWKFGPVIPELYRLVARFRADPVLGRLPEPEAPRFDEEESALIDDVFGKYGRRSGGVLSSLTHRPDTPWAQTWKPDSWAAPISNALIKEHHKDLAETYGQR